MRNAFVDYRSASPPGLTAYAAPCITCVLPGRTPPREPLALEPYCACSAAADREASGPDRTIKAD
jgi:hypothetical protein